MRRAMSTMCPEQMITWISREEENKKKTCGGWVLARSSMHCCRRTWMSLATIFGIKFIRKIDKYDGFFYSLRSMRDERNKRDENVMLAIGQQWSVAAQWQKWPKKINSDAHSRLTPSDKKVVCACTTQSRRKGTLSKWSNYFNKIS